VIEVLGGDYKKHIIERYLQLQLAEYRRIFRSTDEAGQLDNVPRRYAWFRRVLKHHDEEHAALFPASWEVTRLLVASFSEQTRVDLANVLGRAAPNVNVLLDALQATLDFEAAFSRRFNMPFEDVTVNTISPSSSSAKWTISSIFDSHFSVYVDAQDRAISDMLSQYRGARSRPSLEGTLLESGDAGPAVLPSSTELFYFYGQTLDQCSKYTSGEPMVRLAKVFGKWLKIYCDDVLLSGLKKDVGGIAGIRRSVEGRTNLQEVKNACIVLNTAEYCLNTSLQLEERLKDKVKESLRDNVSFQDEREGFTAVMAQCITNILRELESACDPAFAAILKTPWRDLDNVSGRSAYIVDLVGSIKEVAECVRTRIDSKKYIRNFADKATGLVMARFTQAVVKSRPLKKIGAEQILLDVQAVKACLIDLPEPHPENTTTSYTKYVTKTTGQIETMLKVILAPDDPPEGFVQNYCLLIGDRSFTNFQKASHSPSFSILTIRFSISRAQRARTSRSSSTSSWASRLPRTIWPTRPSSLRSIWIRAWTAIPRASSALAPRASPSPRCSPRRRPPGPTCSRPCSRATGGARRPRALATLGVSCSLPRGAIRIRKHISKQ